MTAPILTLTEARVIAVLLEKQRTVPDAYPMSLSALVSGCNQKSARDPVMSLTDQDVLVALESLRQRDWVIETSGSRVMRYEQNAARVLQIAGNGMILLAVLMLRGPQTVAELRSNSQRWYEFADNSSVQAFLEELAERPAGALVVRLPKQPGAREARWAHLMCGEIEIDEPAAETVARVPEPPRVDNTNRLQALEERVALLEQQLFDLQAKLSGDASVMR